MRHMLGEKVLLVPRPSRDQPAVMSRPWSPTFRLGFIGNEADFNIDAMAWFFSSVWPCIKDSRVELVVAGDICRHIPPEDSVRLLGRVDDVLEFYESVHVSVNPVRVASGLKTKNVESISHGVPVITTRAGLGGIEFLEGHGAFCFETVAQFREVLEYVRAPENFLSACVSAVESARQRFSEQACFGTLEESLNARSDGVRGRR